MKTQNTKWTAAWFATVAIAWAALMSAAAAETPTLRVGDKAPKLQVAKWIQGEPVKEFQKGTAYIVEFWATWCGPCKVSIPHLNALHNKFKDRKLVVIGQDCWERDESKVAPFLKTMGDKMTYRVAMDDKSREPKGAMAVTWMEAAGQNGIPSAFIVDTTGVIAWIGHPMTLKEKTLEQVLDGTFDVKQAAAEKAEEEKNQEKVGKFSMALGQAMQAKKWDAAESALQDLEKVLPGDQQDGLTMARVQIAFGRKDQPGAHKLIEGLSDRNKDNAMLQNQLAWDLATRKSLDEQNLKLAGKIAARAVEASAGKDPAILDTLARVQFMDGRKDLAIETQTKALKLADSDSKKAYQKTLDSYRADKLPEAD